MKKLLFSALIATSLLAACSDGEPSAIDEAVADITKDKKFDVNETETIIEVEVTDENIHEDSKDLLLLDSEKIIANIVSMEGKEKDISVRWLGPLTDDASNRENGEVLALMLDAETINSIDWDNYKAVDFEEVATGYRQHAALND